MQLDGPVAGSKDPELAPLAHGSGKAAKSAASRLSWLTVLRSGGRLSPDLLAIAMGAWLVARADATAYVFCSLLRKATVYCTLAPPWCHGIHAESCTGHLTTQTSLLAAVAVAVAPPLAGAPEHTPP
jgi:hypothetical protein